MAFIPCVNIARVNMQFTTNDGQTAENVFAVQNGAAWDSVSLTALANVFISWESAAVAGVAPKNCRSNKVALVNVQARDLTTDTSPEVNVNPSGGPVVGTLATAAHPNGISVAVKGGTGVPGRSSRGRTFWLGLTTGQSSSDANQINSGDGSNLVALLTNLKTMVKAASAAYDLGILSLRHNKVDRVAGQFRPTTFYALTDNFLDYQRRRAPAHNVSHIHH